MFIGSEVKRGQLISDEFAYVFSLRNYGKISAIIHDYDKYKIIHCYLIPNYSSTLIQMIKFVNQKNWLIDIDPRTQTGKTLGMFYGYNYHEPNLRLASQNEFKVKRIVVYQMED